MDQIKSGKLIAKLRKEKGLTQGDLGDMVGVSDRSVSKWERGISFPNVAIINEVCNILGITSNELLNGELNPKDTDNNDDTSMLEEYIKSTELRRKKKRLIILSTLVFITVISLIIAFINRPKTYILSSNDINHFNIYGTVKINKNKIIVNIDRIVFYDKELNNKLITGYELNIMCNSDFIFNQGYINNHVTITEKQTIEEFLKTFEISFENNSIQNIKCIIHDGMMLRIKFLDENNENIEEKLDISMYRPRHKKT